MNLIRAFTILSTVLLAGCRTTPEPGESSVLFNGRDLDGWVVMHGGEWTVEDGALVGREGRDWTTNPELSGSWLRTEKPYADFILELEYAIEGNSGVFFRSALEKNPAFTGYEMQILSDHGREPTRHTTGAIYEVVGATRNMSKPAGEWNRARIEARGPRIRITLNGETVVDVEDKRSASGYIGLQNHDDRSVVKFRNIRVTEL
ncbi:MAG TPA: DUF1080 domain-containing protein [Methylomirabilota bacterium]|nr:DUF1080 domain-containing protein [Methylomirabilota bacterium]